MRRFALYALLVAGLTAAATAWAQEQAPPEPTVPPPTVDQSKPKTQKPMTDEQRARQEQRLDAQWNKLPVETKMHLMRLHRALAEMPAEQRKFVHDRIERFLTMSPTEREKLTQNHQKWEQMSPEERQRAREEYRKQRQAIEDKLNHEHAGESGTNSVPPTPPPGE